MPVSMRLLPISLVSALSLLLAACSGAGSSTNTGTGGTANTAGGATGDAGHNADSTSGAGTVAGAVNAGGKSSSDELVFSDLPGKVRFINYVSDGKAGVNLDLYWGSTIARSEKVGTVHYGEITKFMAPRYAEQPMLDADQARFFLVPEGEHPTDPTLFKVRDERTFDADTVLTVALASSDNDPTFGVTVSEQIFYEQHLSAPPAGMAQVFEWSAAFAQIPEHNFVVVGADDLCDPDLAESDDATNLGLGVLIPGGTKGLALFDANTVPACASGASKISGTVEAGHSYVLLGEAETFEASARHSVLLEVGTTK